MEPPEPVDVVAHVAVLLGCGHAWGRVWAPSKGVQQRKARFPFLVGCFLPRNYRVSLNCSVGGCVGVGAAPVRWPPPEGGHLPS